MRAEDVSADSSASASSDITALVEEQTVERRRAMAYTKRGEDGQNQAKGGALIVSSAQGGVRTPGGVTRDARRVMSALGDAVLVRDAQGGQATRCA